MSAEPAPRLAGPSDLEEIAELLESVDLPARHLEGEDVQLFALREAGALVGCVGFETHGRALLLRSLAVRPAAHARGHGHRLVRTVLEAARARGVSEVVLLTLDAAPFFESLGFARAPREEVDPALLDSWEFLHHACDEAHCLRLRL